MDQYQWVKAMGVEWEKIAPPEVSPRDSFEIRFLDVKTDELILDCGSGNGRFSMAMAKMGADVIAVDINQKMVRILKERSKKGEVFSIQPIVGDMQDLPLRASVFDKIICAGNLWYVANYKKTVYEMLNALKIGGTLLIDHKSLHYPHFLIEAIFEHMKKILTGEHVHNFYRTPKQIIEPFVSLHMRISIKSLCYFFCVSVLSYRLFPSPYRIVDGLRNFAMQYIVKTRKLAAIATH